ncbi:MAG: dihydroneopterin aldolase [Bacteroidetes bacterium]|nr:MAG: dihydroneopterin aldolase [Bacteroidota bacterium]
MIIVELKNIRFHAFHGLYAEERKSGGDYEFNLAVSLEETQLITELNETVNYVRLHELVKQEMNTPRHLLETLLMEIAEKIHAEFPLVKEIDMSVAKLNPPIVNFIGSTSVTYRKQY